MNFGPNEMMMDLFRSEVETHSETLSSALLQLEREPSDTSCYDTMMRAAHSIKGAARIVRVDDAVELAHALEDCFVAAQRGELEIKPSDFDLFLESVDLLSTIAESTKGDLEPGTDRPPSSLHRVVRDLKNLRVGKRESAPSSIPASAQSAPVQVPQHVAPSKGAPVQAALVIKETPVRVRRKVMGHLRRDEAESIRQWILNEIQRPHTLLELDLGETTDLDATSLAFLASARQFVSQSSNCQLVYEPLSEEIKLVFEATGISLG